MSAFKFECPTCGQHLQGDETYIGRQINCPSCQRAMTVPSPASAAPVMPPPPPVRVTPPPPIRVAMPAPVAAAPAPPLPPEAAVSPPPPPPAQPAMRIAVHATPAAKPAAPPPAAPRHIPTPMPMPRFDSDDDEAPSRTKKIAGLAVMVAVALLAGFVLIPMGLKWQKSFNEKQAKDDDPGLIGGQVGHAMELNNVLDATDPDKMGRNADRGPAAAMAGRARKARAMSVESAGGPGAMSADEAETLPVIPATWTLDADAAQIPNGRVAGTVAGASFIADHVFLLTGGATPVLAFRQGSFQNPDRELIVYPKLQPGQTLENQTWTITADQTADVPQVAKRWKAAPNTAPQMKLFPSGYVLKLEFGRMTPEGLPGKIYLALPDAEQSVAGGVFVASVRVAGAPTARRPGAGGQPSMMSDE